MAKYTLPHFGEIDPANLEEYYDVNIDLNGMQINLDLNFDEETIKTKKLDTVKNFIEQLEKFDKKNREYIDKDYNDEDADTVKNYIDHHLAIGEDELNGIVDFNDKSISPQQQMINKLRLIRVGFYPDDEDDFAVFDYSIGRTLTDYLIVININEKGKLEYLTMES